MTWQVPDSVEETHACIKGRAVHFPDEPALSEPAKDLILSLLQKEPDSRPSLDTILAHPFLADAIAAVPEPATPQQ